MKKSKVVRLLQSCDRSELAALAQFLASPYYNEDENTTRLFHYLYSFYPDFNAAALDKKKVFQHIFPDQVYEDKQLRYLISHLNKRIEQFLAVRAVEQQPYHLRLALLETLSVRGLQKNYRQVAHQLEQDLAASTAQSSDFFLTQLQWSELKEQHFQRQRVRRFDPDLQHFADHLDKYYYLNRLKIACAMLDRQTILQTEYALHLSEDWIHHLEQRAFCGEPIIQLYYTIYQALLQEAAEDYFLMLKNQINEYYLAIAKEDLKDIYLFAINYCAGKSGRARKIM